MAKSKILIVEDEWIIANDIKSSLKDLGYSVVAVVATGKEAIEKSETKSPDLVLMDIVLQGEIDGIQAASHIMSCLDIPIVYLTAYTDDAVLKQAKKSGAYGYLVKPFKDREMQATIEMALYKHQMEKMLKQSESRLLTTLRSINDAVISTDRGGAVTFMNPLAKSLTGFKSKHAKGRHLKDIFNIKSNEPEFLNTTVNNIIQEGLVISQAQYFLFNKDNTPINIELSSAPITDDKENISGLVIVFRDISRRIQVEKELEEYREQLEEIARERTAKLKLFSDIVEKSPDGVQIIDFNGQILYSNTAVEKIYGYSCEELKGKNVKELNDDPDFASKYIMPSIRDQGQWDGELMVKDKNGNRFAVWLAAFTVNDSDNMPAGIIGIIRDLTERKKAEQLIRDSEEKFRNLFNQASDSIFLLSTSENDLIIEDTNDAALLMHGYSRKELIGKPISILDNLDARDNIQDRTKRLMKGELLHFETSHVRKDGSTFPVEVSAQSIHIGEKPFILAFDRDITERKLVEDKLMHYYEKLEELVRERTRELIEANENLQVEIGERKKAEKTLLSYQKQLQSLTSQLALLEENEKRRIATELHDAVGQTLALSKIKLGQLNKSASSPEMKSSIKEILQLVEQTIKETRTLTFELSPPILYELGLNQAIQWLIDQFRAKHDLNITLESDGFDKQFDNNVRFFLFQAIRELLFNIVKHAHATEVTLTMSGSSRELQIIIDDNGIGFSKPSVHYDGFGLFNIRERMNHINGTFEIKSKPGRGTRVTLVAPFEVNAKLHEKELI